MLMIGGASSNTGKTVLSCSLIQKFQQVQPIEAIKVTTIRDRNQPCPRGGPGCGVCSSMQGKFCIVEETNATSGKDTSRLLAAGCRRVFWLRSLQEHLAEGFQQLQKKLSQDALYLCESNSLRKFVEPGLFLFVKPKCSNTMKDSAREVQSLVDFEMEWDGEKFDFDIQNIEIVGNQWILRESATAIVLAGGNSSRMGQNKALLPIHGHTIIQSIIAQLQLVVKEIIISAKDISSYSFPGVTVVADEIPGQGPFHGIVQAMQAATYPICFVVACDIPDIPVRLMRRMIHLARGADAVVPQYNHDPEPLFAVYSRNLLPRMKQSLANGNRKLQNIYSDCTITYIPIEAPIVNLNDMNQYREYVEQHTPKHGDG